MTNTPADTIINVLDQVIQSADKPAHLHEPRFNGNEWQYVKECLDTGWVSSVGSYVNLFEEKLAEKCGVSHAILTVNGTAALHTALILMGVKSGDEVIIPTLTFIATANAVTYCGATPHFVDSDAHTLGIDAVKLDNYLAQNAIHSNGNLINKNTGKRIAAIVPVHIFGHACNMVALSTVANKYNLPIISDAAEALGSFYHNKPLASYGDISAVSFNGNKVITTGGGGAILTNDDKIAAHAKHITTTAKVPHKWDFVHDEIGYNYRMPNLNAALGCAQLEQLDTFVESKRRLAERYIDKFSENDAVRFIQEPEGCRSNYWLCAIQIHDAHKRNETLQSLHDNGYICRPIWKLMHTLPMFQNCPRMDLAIAGQLEQTIINLPSSVKLGLTR